MKTISRILILFIITLIVVNCSYEDENEELKIETINENKYASPTESNILIHYSEHSTEEDRIAIRNNFFSDCKEPYIEPCTNRVLTIKLGYSIPYNSNLEFWHVEICDSNTTYYFDPDCEGGLKADIENEDGVDEVDN